MKATLYALANRGLESGAGLVTLTLVGVFFTPEQQGFYYTFLGLLAFQTLIDLGFASVIQAFASHEWAEPDKSSRLASLVRFALRWYAVCGLVVSLGLWLGGSYYFATFAKAESVAWFAAWSFASLLTGISLLLTPVLALLEGTGEVERVYRTRLAQSVAGRIAGALAILGGLGLFAVPATRFASVAAGLAGVGRRGLGFLRSQTRRAEGQGRAVSWARELWPLQWRIAVSSAGGYLLFSLFTPVLFASHGPEVAGRMGMSLSAVTALGSAAFAFVATQQAPLALLAARRELTSMDALFSRAVRRAFVFAAAGALVLTGALALVPGIQSRFLPWGETALLLAGMLVQQARFAMASYLRAHKEAPFAGLSALEGVLAVGVLAPLGAAYGSLGMTAGFLVLSAALFVPAVAIFTRSRASFHSRADVWAEAS